jgi:hypothetical protein
MAGQGVGKIDRIVPARVRVAELAAEFAWQFDLVQGERRAA